ncbi:MAG: ribosome-associated translation inhibitor RaiA [Acidimicrobiales bacterium]
MDVTVSSRHTDVPDNLRLVAEEKIGRLARFLEGMDRAEVHFSEERNPRIADREICEVTLEGHGHHVRCKVRAADGFVAVDRAVEKLEQQLHKLKTKLKKRKHTGGRVAPVGALVDRPEPNGGGGPTEDAPAAEPRVPRIVKSKRFAKMAMTPEEAVARMGLLGHDFFFFTNIDTHRAAVVYAREDGDVGLIDEDG